MKRLFLLAASVLGTLMLASSVHATLLFTVNSGGTTSIPQTAVTGTVGTYDIQGDLVDDGVGTLKLTNLYIRATSPGGASDTIYFMSDTAAWPAGTTGQGTATVTGDWTHSTTGFSSTPTTVVDGEFTVSGWLSGVAPWGYKSPWGWGSGGDWLACLIMRGWEAGIHMPGPSAGPG